jgi:PST family polysaccharide transporter
MREPSLRKNIASLYAVQFASYAAPLVTLPWLTRVLGPSGFGRLSFCVAVTAYFTLFADFGFNLSATRQIATRWNDRPGRSTVFWNTITAKALLACIGFLCLLVLTLCIHRFAEERSLLLINYLTVLATVLTPVWYMQGTERQVVLSGITIAVRVIAIPAVFLLVRSTRDIQMAALISSGTQLAGGLLCLGYLLRARELDRVQVDRHMIVQTLRDGWHLFLSTASTSLYSTTNTVLLGFVSGSTAVGHYSAAEKMMQAAQGILGPINQSVYPRVSRLMQESQGAAFALIRKVLKVQGSIAFALSLVLFAIAPWLIRLLYGAAYEETIGVLRWLAWLPFLVGLSNVFGIHTMLPMGMKKAFSRILIIAGAINVLTLFVLAHWYGAAGAAAAVVGTELFVTAVMMWVLVRRNVPIFRVRAVT